VRVEPAHPLAPGARQHFAELVEQLGRTPSREERGKLTSLAVWRHRIATGEADPVERDLARYEARKLGLN